MRLLVVITVLHGFLPGFGPAAKASVGVPPGGEQAVAAASAPGQENSNPEDGCGVTLHLCSCCVSQPVLPPAVAPGPRELAPTAREPLGVEQGLAHREPDRPFRPPIG